MTLGFSVEWQDFMREPQETPNPDFPEGKDIPAPPGAAKACKVDLPYPAKRCGIYLVRCFKCGVSVGCTTAGRPDDPRSVQVPCFASHTAFAPPAGRA